MAEHKGLDPIQKELLAQVADLHKMPEGAYSLRINGKLEGKNSSEHIQIVKKQDAPGIDIYIQPGTKNESMHIPVLLSQTGLKELVYNDFHIGADCDVTIVEGCGIHNAGDGDSGQERQGEVRGEALRLGRRQGRPHHESHHRGGDGRGFLHGDGDRPDQGRGLHQP